MMLKIDLVFFCFFFTGHSVVRDGLQLEWFRFCVNIET